MKGHGKSLKERAEEEAEAIRDDWERMSRRQKKAIVAAEVILGIILLFAGGWTYAYRIDHPARNGSTSLEIRREMTGSEIAGLLESHGVIRSELAFRLALAATGDGAILKSGHYRLPLGMTVEDAIKALKKGQQDFRTVTVPEGFTAAQIEGLLQRERLAAGQDFLEEARSYAPLPYMYGPEAAEVKGEGFLFPDTYDIPTDYTARQVCDLMYKRMDQILTPQLRQQAEERGMTLHALITMASMVEKEARWPEDQGRIASVILARLAAGMPLQIDATVQYVLGESKEQLTTADTRIPSSYNTYLRPGLPPGPIASPGVKAIHAVLAAQPGEYLYYVAKTDGHHLFARTYEEHQDNIRSVYGQG